MDIPQDAGSINKQCSSCKREFPATAEYFYRDKRNKDGLVSICKQCQLARDKIYREQHKEQQKARAKQYAANNPEKVKAYKRKYATNNPEKVALSRKQYQEKKPEKVALSKKRYEEKNGEKIAEYRRQYKAKKRKELNQNRQLNPVQKPEKLEAQNHEKLEARIKAKHEKYLKYRQKHYEEILKKKRCYRQQHAKKLSAQQRAYYAEHREEVANYQKQYRQTKRGIIVQRTGSHNRRARKKNAPGKHTSAQLRELFQEQEGKCFYCGIQLGMHRASWHSDHYIPLSKGGSNDISNIVITCPTCNLKKNDKLPHEWEKRRQQ